MPLNQLLEILTMKRHKLTTKHKLLILLIQVGHGKNGVTFNVSRRELIRAFEIVWKMKISKRQISRLTRQLEKEGVIKRHDRRLSYGYFGRQAQATYYEIIDAEKGFADLFDTPGKKRKYSHVGEKHNRQTEDRDKQLFP